MIVSLEGAASAFTVTLMVRYFFGLRVDTARTSVVPAFLAVTSPVEDTDAIEELLTSHLTDWAAVAGSAEAVSW